jgi:hypothetical protein
MEQFAVYDVATIAVAGLVITLGILFFLIRKVNRLEKMRDEEKIVLRISVLEKELEHYIQRSQRRLDIFKRVIDGFDHVVQGIKGVIEDDEADSFDARLTKEERELISERVGHGDDSEAEVIHIDNQQDRK